MRVKVVNSFLSERAVSLESSSFVYLCDRMTERIKKRISLGMNTNMESMETASLLRDGAYSKRHGKARKASALSVEIMNLEFTGDTKADFRYKGRNKNVLSFGMESNEAFRVSEENEQYQGLVYSPSEKEKDIFFQEILDLML
jgi:hypothetical protein